MRNRMNNNLNVQTNDHNEINDASSPQDTNMFHMKRRAQAVAAAA